MNGVSVREKTKSEITGVAVNRREVSNIVMLRYIATSHENK